MQFGIKKGSSKEIALDHISKLIKAKLIKINSFCEDQKPSNTELFIEICYDLAKGNDMTATMHLDHAFIVDDKMNLKGEKLLAVKFQKNKY